MKLQFQSCIFPQGWCNISFSIGVNYFLKKITKIDFPLRLIITF
jgi:hypothetical protein